MKSKKGILMLAEIWPDIIALVLTFITIFGFSLLFSLSHKSSIETIESQVSSHLNDEFIADLLQTNIEYKGTHLPIAQALGIYFENKDPQLLSTIENAAQTKDFKQKNMLIFIYPHSPSALELQFEEAGSIIVEKDADLGIYFNYRSAKTKISENTPLRKLFSASHYQIPGAIDGKIITVIIGTAI